MSNVKNAKYRVKNAEGQYDVIHFETGMEQVEGLNSTVEGINAEVATKAVKSDVDAEFQNVEKEIDAVEAVAAGLNTRLTKAEGDITKEISDRQAAITGVQGEVSKVAGDLAKEVTRATGAEKALEERIAAVEGEVGTDLGDLRDVVASNTAAIGKEVTDRQGEITRVEGLVSAEEARAKAAEKVNADAIATKVAQSAFDAEVVRVNGELAKKADKTQVATDIAAAVNVEKERALAAEGKLQEGINKVGSDLSAEITRAKGEEARIEGLAKVAQEEVDALEVVVGNNKTTIEGTVSTLEGKVDGHIASSDVAISGINGKISAVEGRLNVVEPKVTSLEGTVATHSTEIADLKAAVSDKNSNTLVFATMEEFNGASLSPKVGDLAFVLDIKKAFIYKGAKAVDLSLPTPPQGWVYFDEISTEIDLVNYAKKADLAAEVAKLDKADSDLNAAIQGAIEDSVAADVALTTAIEAEVSRAKEAEGKIASDLTAEIARAKAAEQANATEIAAVKASVYTKEEADSMVDVAIKEQMPVVGNAQPSNKNQGHVWLELM